MHGNLPVKRDRRLLGALAVGMLGFAIGYGVWAWRKLGNFDDQERVH
jgi:hypothetical protein